MKFISYVFVATVALLAANSSPAAADGKAESGESLFKKHCRVCHSVQPGKHLQGPSLFGVFGRKAGTAENFKRYKGLKGADWTWNEELLDQYLTDPKEFSKARTGTSTLMILKVKKPEDRADLIAYLKSLK